MREPTAAAGIDTQGYTFDARSAGGFYGEDRYSFTQNNPCEVVTERAVRAIVDNMRRL